MATAKTRRPELGWEPFLSRCTRGLWRLQVRQLTNVDGGVPVRSTIDMPQDGDVENALARAGFPPARYSVRPEFKGRKGESWTIERRKLLMAAYTKIPVAVVELSPNLAAAPRSEQKARGSVLHARELADLAVERKRQVEAELEIARMEADKDRLRAPVPEFNPDAMLEKLAAKLQPQPQQQGDLVLEVVKLQGKMLENAMAAIAKAQEAMLQRIEQAVAQQAPAAQPAPGNALPGIIDQLEAMERLRDLVQDRTAPKSELREGLDLIREFLAMRAGAAAGSVPPAMQGTPPARMAQVPGRTAGPAALPSGPGADKQVLRQRCEQFVGALVHELQNDSDPDAVADAVWEQVGFLPGPVRSELQRGDWQRAWAALQLHVDADTWQGLDAMLKGSPESMAWLAKFAQALTPEDEDAEDAAA